MGRRGFFEVIRREEYDFDKLTHSFFLVPTGPPMLNESLQRAEERQLHLQWDPPEPQYQNGVIINYMICIEPYITAHFTLMLMSNTVSSL